MFAGQVSYLYLEGNNISSLDLGLISLYPQLVVLKLGRNHVKSLTNSEANNLQFRIGLEELDLSQNSLQVEFVLMLWKCLNLIREGDSSDCPGRPLQAQESEPLPQPDSHNYTGQIKRRLKTRSSKQMSLLVCLIKTKKFEFPLSNLYVLIRLIK